MSGNRDYRAMGLIGNGPQGKSKLHESEKKLKITSNVFDPIACPVWWSQCWKEMSLNSATCCVQSIAIVWAFIVEQMRRDGWNEAVMIDRIKVPSVTISGEQGGSYLCFFSLWATQLCKHSKCYSWGLAIWYHCVLFDCTAMYAAVFVQLWLNEDKELEKSIIHLPCKC